MSNIPILLKFQPIRLLLAIIMANDNEEKIISSWQINAFAWSEAIENKAIESRTLSTNQAIIDAIGSKNISTALDIGCGEGWLVRALANQGVQATGIDAIESFIQLCISRKKGKGNEKAQFLHLTYDDIIEGKLIDKFDAIVCNFSLFGKDSVDNLIAKLPTNLNPNGRLIIQTLHPDNFESESNGWIDGSWDGFSDSFVEPAPWYFRTLQSWSNLFEKSNFKIIETLSPKHPVSGKPVSIIFILSCA